MQLLSPTSENMTQHPPTKRPFTLRLAQPKDVPSITSLGSSVFAASFGYSLPPSDLEDYLNTAYSPSSIASDLSSPNIDVIVAVSPENDDQVLGFSQLTQGTIEPCVKGSEKPIELQRLYVSQECHGKGVARALVEKVEEMARKRGFKTMWLGVWEENFKAQKVYGKFGFVRVGEHDFKMGTCIQTDWIMSKNL